ncbi:RE1 [Symbiodinium sp. CCMP2456]|nr:RE1 [Symbiodinium sp. CCMP2456]
MRLGSATSTSSSSYQRPRCHDWARMASGLKDLIHLQQDLEAHIVTMRLAKYRAPSIMAGLEAMARIERGPEMMPATTPPMTTTAPGQTKRSAGCYPNKIDRCRHHPDLARRTGNNHGQFMECLACGKMWKAVTYKVPYTAETIPVYVLEHGYRNIPGGKILKKGIVQETGGRFPSLQDCYSSRPAPSSAAPPKKASQLPRASSSKRKGKDSTNLTTITEKSEGPMLEDGEDSEDLDKIDLRKLKPAERERLQREAAQRLEDRRQHEAREYRRREEKATDRYTKPGAPPKVKMAFEAPPDERKTAAKASGKKIDEDTESISNHSYSEVEPVTDQEAARLERQMTGARLDSSRWPRRKFGYDLVEILGGHSMVSIRAVHHWDLKVLQPVDLRYGLDLRRPADQQWLLDILAKFNPRLAVVEFPYTPWSRVGASSPGPDPRGTQQEDDRIYLHLAQRIFEEQKRRGGHAMAEVPSEVATRSGRELEGLREQHYETASELLTYDFANKGNHVTTRRVRFVATHPLLVRGLTPGVAKETDEHQPLYPPALGDAICRAYRDVVSAEDFGTSTTWATTTSRAVHYVDAVRREDDWRPLLEQAQELLGRKTAHSLQVHPGTDLYKKVEALVPWQLASVQVAYLPKAKRVKTGLEECHRASVMLHNDNSITVETEFLKDAQAPRERFVAPVRVAIFVLGYAPGEPDAPAPARQAAAQPAPEDEPVRDEVQEGLEREGLARQDFAGECWFSGGPLKPNEKVLAKALVRMHRNLGHPRQEDFTRALVQNSKVAPEAIALSRRLRCATCERTRRPLPPRPTSLKATAGPFNSRVCLDFVHLHDAEKAGHLYLHVLEPNGSYNVFCPVESRVPAHVFEVFTTIWATWAGYPDVLVVDQDGAFESDFADKINALGSVIEPIAAQSHWQAGQVEAYNRAFRYAAAKAIDEHSLSGAADMKMLGAMIGAALNDKIRTCGCSPNEWLFGRSPKTPWDLLSPDGKIQAMQGLEQDAELRRRQQVRATADAKVAEFAVNNSLRQAVLRLDRPGRNTYEPGELVAFWREAKMKKDPKSRKPRRVPAGWYRGTIIGPHKGSHEQSNYWVTSGGRCLLVSKEQLRPAYGTELWRVQESELQNILDAPPETFEDIRGQGPAEAVAHDPGEVIPFFEGLDDLDFSDQGTLPPTPGGVPLTPRGPPVRDQALPEGLGPEERERSPRRLEPEMIASAAPSVGTDLTQASPTMRSYAAPHPEEPEAKRLRLEETENEAPEAHVHLCNLYVPATLEELYAKPDQHFAANVLCQAVNRSACTTRKEQKALEKEIPYSMIPEQELPDYHEALVKEWGVWTKYEATHPLDLEASAAVEASFDRARILDTRDRDPDLLTLRRDAPTMTRMSLMVILQIASSMTSWFLFNSDVTGAFLQGDQSLASRKEPLFLRQPKEGLPGLVAGQLLLVVRGIFGLANSPRLFWRHLRDTLKKIGFVQSVLDKALFMYYKAGRLILVLGAHVDDLLGTGEPGTADEVLERVKKAFDFGAWADSRTDEVLEYGGKQISKLKDGTVTLCQEKFIQAISVYNVPRWRSVTPLEPLSPAEVTELKSGGGCLHWLIGQTRPDLAAATSLNMSGQPTVNNLVEINKLLREAQKTQDWKMTFVPVPLDKAKIIAFSDASWANAEGLKSQAGFLTFVAGPEVMTVQGDQASLMDWRSHRIQRQCRSTLAAETMAMDTAFDSGIFLRELLAEVLVQSYMPVQSGSLPPEFLPVHPVTDCRSLFDLLTKDGPVSSTQEKRLTIDISAIKEGAEEFDPEGEALREIFKWADTDHQLADHLTKAKPPHQLRDLLAANWLSLQANDPT